MMTILAVAILVFLAWRAVVSSLPTSVDRSPGGHWHPEPRPSDPPAAPEAEVVDVPVVDPPARRRAPLADPVPVPDEDTVDDDCDDCDDDSDPLDESTPYDSKRCWGCSRKCTYRGFRVPEGGTRDEIHRIAEGLHRAEHGCASDLDAVDGSDIGRASLAAEDLTFDPIAVARRVGAAKRAAWFAQCEACVDYLRRCRDEGIDPEASTVETAADVVAAECPF